MAISYKDTNAQKIADDLSTSVKSIVTDAEQAYTETKEASSKALKEAQKQTIQQMRTFAENTVNDQVNSLKSSDNAASQLAASLAQNTILVAKGETSAEVAEQQMAKASKDAAAKITSDLINNSPIKMTGKTVDVKDSSGETVATINTMTNKDIANLVKNSSNSTLAQGVAQLIDKSIDDIVADQIDLKTKQLQNQFSQTEIGELYNKGKSVYDKILESDKLITDWKKSYTTSLEKSVDSKINSWVDSIGNSLGGGWVSKFLKDSKLAANISLCINTMITSTINAIISDENIKRVTTEVKNTVLSIKNKIVETVKERFKTAFKAQIEFVNNLKSAIKAKLQQFEVWKQQVLTKLTNYLNQLAQKLAAYMATITKAITDALVGVFSSALGGLSF